MSLRSELEMWLPKQTQGPKCAIRRYADAYPEDADDLLELIADDNWLASRLSITLEMVRNWRIPEAAIRKHRKKTCGCYQRLRTDGPA